VSAPAPPSDVERLYRATCAGAVVFLVLYALPLALEGPSLWYLPLERRWVLGFERPAGLVMDWYGRTLLSALAALVVAVLAARRRAPLRSARAWALAVAAAFVVGLAAYAWVLHQRELAPTEPGSPPLSHMLHRSNSGLLRRTISG
jgi:hypothetical protein